jgi:4a-hydroxytetrahydrobiopterin dehydratase
MARQVSMHERGTLMIGLTGWKVREIEGVERLVRTFEMPSYREALRFTMQVGEIAEAMNHHPTITLEWRRVTVQCWTHTAQGLSVRDFDLARAINDAHEQDASAGASEADPS